jgi:F-type H+-transporting ATPase subunit epsilon
MAELIELEVATPERELVRQEVDEIQLPGKDGYLGILPGHAPLLGQLGTGTLSYGVSGKRWYLSVHGGFVQVLPDHVRVLANEAERAEEIDLDRARAALRQAEEQMARADSPDPDAVLDRVAAAQARVDAAEKK